MGGGVVLFCACLMSFPTSGQKLVWKDTILLVGLNHLADSGSLMIKFCITQDLEYAVTCSNILVINWKHDPNTNQVSLLQHVKYQSQFNNNRNLKISNSFVHDLGIQCFFDSISRFQPDENTLDTRLEFSLSKNFSFSAFSRLSTRLFNAYNYATGTSGSLCKTLNASFLTPLIWTMSAGFGWTVPRFVTLSVGLSSAKLTCVYNRGIFDQLKVSDYYGVPKDKNHIFEYGLSMHILVDRDVSNRVHWNCDVLMFKNYKKPVDVVLNNLVGIRINKFLKTSIQTHLLYESAVSKHLQIENMISAGFCINL